MKWYAVRTTHTTLRKYLLHKYLKKPTFMYGDIWPNCHDFWGNIKETWWLCYIVRYVACRYTLDIYWLLHVSFLWDFFSIVVHSANCAIRHLPFGRPHQCRINFSINSARPPWINDINEKIYYVLLWLCLVPRRLIHLAIYLTFSVWFGFMYTCVYVICLWFLHANVSRLWDLLLLSSNVCEYAYKGMYS